MKRIVLLLLLAPIVFYAQTNTFPASGNVGIGTTNPDAKLDVVGIAKVTNNDSYVSIIGTGTANYNGGTLRLTTEGVSSGNEHASTWFMTHRATDGTATVEFQRRNLSGVYRGTTLWYQDGVGWKFQVASSRQSTSTINAMNIDENGNVGVGTTNPDAKFTVKGNIHTREVKVDLAGAVAPDYVFKEDYHLRSLEEVQAHIKEKGHLPGIPSAEEMENEGINLKEINLKLLEKVEELTLYVIEQRDEINSLKRIFKINEQSKNKNE